MSWCTIESDPGVFTELLETIGVKGVQVEELYDLEQPTFNKLKPVFGLIFLFKWQKDERDNRPTLNASNSGSVFFAKQTIANACATQAIISILLNRSDIELGKELTNFKSFVGELPPDIRGMAIGSIETIRLAHNSFARPEPFIFDEKKDDGEEEDAFHFIGFVPVNGHLYELDGLKAGPIRLTECTMDNWLDKVKPVIEERIRRYSEKEIRFNLLAIIRNRKDALNEELKTIDAKKVKIDADIQANSNKSAPAQGTMDTSDSESSVEDSESSVEDLKHMKEMIEEEIRQIKMQIQNEETKYKSWKSENVRRRHNYVPFVFNLIKLLAEKGKLDGLVEAGKKTSTERIERAKKNQNNNDKNKSSSSTTTPTTATK